MTPPRRLSADLIALHWAVALLFLLSIGTVLSRGELAPGDPWRPMLRQGHMVIGVVILLAGAVRLGVRLSRGVPPLHGQPPQERWLKRAVDVGLYGVMLVQPLLGVAYVQAGGKAVMLLGAQLPTLVNEQAALHHQLREWHQGFGIAFYVLLLLHVGAALLHHFVRRDRLLASMLALNDPPASRSRPKARRPAALAAKAPGISANRHP